MVVIVDLGTNIGDFEVSLDLTICIAVLVGWYIFIHFLEEIRDHISFA